MEMQYNNEWASIYWLSVRQELDKNIMGERATGAPPPPVQRGYSDVGKGELWTSELSTVRERKLMEEESGQVPFTPLTHLNQTDKKNLSPVVQGSC